MIVYIVIAASAILALTACTSAPPPLTTIPLGGGRQTRLGLPAKSANLTASEFAELQAAETGKLTTPASVEFFADN